MFPRFWRKAIPKIVEKVEPAQSMLDVARASSSAPDAGPWVVREWVRPGSIALQSKDLRHEVALIVDGAFDSPEQRLAYANDLAVWMNQQIEQTPLPEPEVLAAEVAQTLSESTASRLSEAPEPEVALVAEPLPAEPVLDEGPELMLDAAPEPAAEREEPQSLCQRVTKLIHSTSFPLGRKPANLERPLEHVPERVEKPAQELDGVASEPSPEVSVREPVAEGPCACHFDLQPDQQPDACVIDQGHPEFCTIARSGVAKELCPHWLPIRIVPRAAAN